MQADLVEMGLHGESIRIRHDDGRTNVARGADCAENICVFVSLIFRLTRTRAALRPLINEAVLLADASFILEPDLDRRSCSNATTFQRFLDLVREVFLKSSITSASCAGWRGRALI